MVFLSELTAINKYCVTDGDYSLSGCVLCVADITDLFIIGWVANPILPLQDVCGDSDQLELIDERRIVKR